MSGMMDSIRESYRSLNSRERLIVSSGAVVLLLMGIYFLAWEPLLEKQVALNASIKSQQAAYQKMQKSAVEVKQLQGSVGVKNINASAMQSIINRTAKSALPGAIIKRVEQTRQQAVQVWVDQVAFDDMVKWLGGLQQTKGVRIIALVTERTTQVGRVNVRLTLKAG